MLTDIIYSQHAAQRMAQRDFSESDVRLLLAKGAVRPDKKHKDRLNAYLMLRGREAKLAYVMEGRNLVFVVSIMWRDEDAGDPPDRRDAR